MNIHRTCLRCGRPLPPESSQSRTYCEECGKERNRELTRRREEKARQTYAAALQEKHNEEDRAYCRGCAYYGSENYGNNLCDYIIRTGHRRGCKAGVGCEKFTPKKGE